MLVPEVGVQLHSLTEPRFVGLRQLYAFTMLQQTYFLLKLLSNNEKGNMVAADEVRCHHAVWAVSSENRFKII